MNMKLLGIQIVDFINKQGEHITGCNLFVCHKDDKVDGLCTAKFFVNGNILLPKDMAINDTINVSFNHKGKILGITKA